jgi:hypothetical protein
MARPSARDYNGGMRELCHRCHGELPSSPAGSRHDDDAVVLFCPRCGAPQILLPEHMHIEAPVVATPSTTGAIPPPRPGGVGQSQIDWRVAIASGAIVAGVGAVLSVLGMKLLAFSFFSLMWTISCAVITLGLYARRRPIQRMDARVGMRIGLAAGVLMVSAIAMATATTGVVLRFGTHQMARFDRESAQRRKEIQVQFLAFLEKQTQDKDLIAQYSAALNSPQANSPEMLAGSALAGGAVQGFFILLLSAGGGAFAGMMRASQAQRLDRRRGD